MSKETADILRQARALIEPEAQWTTRVFARNAEGHPVSACRDDAVCFCALGALESAAHGRPYWRAFRALQRAVARYENYENIAEANDIGGHAAVLALYARAIAAEEAKP